MERVRVDLDDLLLQRFTVDQLLQCLRGAVADQFVIGLDAAEAGAAEVAEGAVVIDADDADVFRDRES